eukprot:scaffold173785_cov51-Attheya_sp.AAC.4
MEEKAILSTRAKQISHETYAPDAKIFVYDVSQLAQGMGDDGHKDEGSILFREGLRDCLGLEEHLLPATMVHDLAPPCKFGSGEKIQNWDEQYSELRKKLVDDGTGASRWIREYFLNSKDVFVSQTRDHFEQILQTWEDDPCVNNTN